MKPLEPFFSHYYGFVYYFRGPIFASNPQLALAVKHEVYSKCDGLWDLFSFPRNRIKWI